MHLPRLTAALAVLVLAAAPVVLPAATPAPEPPVLSLWPGIPPGSESKDAPESVRLFGEEPIISSVHRPSLTVFLPLRTKSTGAAIVICPGGGHRELWFDHEGIAVARWLNDHGIAAFILKYRLAREPGSTYRTEVESLADARRAVQFVRSYAADWHLDPARIGIMGFSAGGHLASLAAAQPIPGTPGALDPVDATPSRPAFQILIYPGVSPTLVPPAGSPPAFLLCGDQDTTTPPLDLIGLYQRFKSAGVSAELHIVAGEGHGFGLRDGNHHAAAHWIDRVYDWLDERGFLRPLPKPAPAAPAAPKP